MTDKNTSRHGPSDRVDRRAFLGASGLVAAGLTLAPVGPIIRRARAADVTPRTAKNLIFVVSDGMSMGTLQMADMLIERRDARRSHWATMLGREDVHQAIMDTRSADSIVTDSAAAATQWGTGAAANNGAIGMTPDGAFPEPILVRARRAGKMTGLVTTCRITHATPAGFVANIGGNRDDEGPIAEQMLDRRVDLLLGGGGKFVTQELLRGHADIDVVRTAAALAAWKGETERARRLIGLFDDDHMDFEIDRTDTQPTLAAMTRAALAYLGEASSGFVVQIEGGRVDHAAHSNDAAALIHDQRAFDEALGVAFEWAQRRDDTLVILTTDHGNANPAVTDYGARGGAGFERLMEARHSFVWLNRRLEQLRPRFEDEAVRELVREATGVALESRDLGFVMRWLKGEDVDPFVLASKGAGPLASVLANHYAVAFLSPNHTSDLVPVSAWGPGAERLPGYLTMREMHTLMVGAMGIA